MRSIRGLIDLKNNIINEKLQKLRVKLSIHYGDDIIQVGNVTNCDPASLETSKEIKQTAQICYKLEAVSSECLTITCCSESKQKLLQDREAAAEEQKAE